MDGEDIMGAVSDVVSSVGDVVGGALNTVGNVIDKAVSNPLETAAIIGTALVAPEFLPALGETAATETGLSTLGSSVLPASEAFATGSELAAIPEATSSFGLSAAAPTAEFGTFNPSTVSSIGLQSPDLSTLGSLGGTAAMDVGTAGLTAEQLSNANLAAALGSNASSGLGYLGGMESLPSGTAGITGVSSGTNWPDISKSLSNIMGGMNPTGLASALTGGQVNIGGTPIPKSNQPAFGYTQQLPIQSTPNLDKTGTPYLSGQPQLLANLLKG
jgi:hypothetical protein